MDERPGVILTVENLSACMKTPKSMLCTPVGEGNISCRKLSRQWRSRKAPIYRFREDAPAPCTPQAGAPGAAKADQFLRMTAEQQAKIRDYLTPFAKFYGYPRREANCHAA